MPQSVMRCAFGLYTPICSGICKSAQCNSCSLRICEPVGRRSSGRPRAICGSAQLRDLTVLLSDVVDPCCAATDSNAQKFSCSFLPGESVGFCGFESHDLFNPPHAFHFPLPLKGEVGKVGKQGICHFHFYPLMCQKWVKWEHQRAKITRLYHAESAQNRLELRKALCLQPS